VQIFTEIQVEWQLWEEGKGERVCALACVQEKRSEGCAQNDSFFISLPSPSLSSSDAPLFTRHSLSSRRLWVMQGQLQRHRQPLDSSFEILAEPPSPLGRLPDSLRSGAAQPRFCESKHSFPAPCKHPIERCIEGINWARPLLSQHDQNDLGALFNGACSLIKSEKRQYLSLSA